MPNPFNPALTVEEVDEAFSGYNVIEQLGEGGQGTVFRATTPDSKQVAIKLYSPDQSFRRAELEVEKLLKIDCPYVVKMVNHGSINLRKEQCFFGISEFKEGSDLSNKLLNKTTLSVEETKKMLFSIATAIDEMWKRRVVHCDLKPSNILSLSSGEYVVIDLGLAKHLDQETMTAAGIILGTWGYIAPEQLDGRSNLTSKVDIFALGIIAYECLSGSHPFRRNSNLLKSITPTPLNKLIGLEDTLSDLIRDMLNISPLKRPISGKAIIERI